jgi:hypothetical protein
MPDVGVFRAETHSHYAASEIAGAVDLIKSAVGPDAVIPIRLRIEQRQRKAGGQTKKFPVVVVELRGITTGQVLAGSVMTGALPAQRREEITAPSRPAIEAAPVQLDQSNVEQSLRAIQASGTLDDLRLVWPEAKAAGLEELALKIADEFKQAIAARPPSGDPDELWAEIMRTVPSDWSTSKVEEDFETTVGRSAESADAADMTKYLTHLAEVTS